MIGSELYSLTWDNFNTLHQDKPHMFEALCRSLFVKKRCDRGTSLQSNPNHPGLETAPVFSSIENCRIGFQAKYFTNAVDYRQIKRSAEEIIKHYYGAVDKVFLYCNKDLNTGNKSFQDIKQLLQEAGIELALITGQSILDEAIDEPCILSCYFGLDSIDNSWFAANLQLSLDNLGKRYNHLFNIDTEARRLLSLFLGNNDGVKYVNEKLDKASRELRLAESGDSAHSVQIESIRNSLNSLPRVSFCSIQEALNWEDILREDCRDAFDELEEEKEKIQANIEEIDYKDPEFRNGRNKLFSVQRLISFPDFLSFSNQEKNLIRRKLLFIDGSMGNGKTQLLATSAKEALEEGHDTILLLGHMFTSSESIERQIPMRLQGLNVNQTLEALFAVLEERAFQTGKDAIIYIDAINESRDREIWSNGLNGIIQMLNQYDRIKLVISLRSGFETMTLNDHVLQGIKDGSIARITHNGFVDTSPSAIHNFLSYYGIPFSAEYYLHSEMTNPLFLTWFCQTYNGKDRNIFDLIECVIQQADKEAAKEIGSEPNATFLIQLLSECIDLRNNSDEPLTKKALFKLPAWDIYGVSQKNIYINAIERFGIITSYLDGDEELYYFGYNLLEEYIAAKLILDTFSDKEKVKEHCKNALLGINEKGEIVNYKNKRIFVMLTALFARKYGEECIDVIDDITDAYDKDTLIDDYYRTFIWRSDTVKYDDFKNLLKVYPISYTTAWEIFIENATKESCEINADVLSDILFNYEMKDRDYYWTTYINGLTDYDRIINLVHFIESNKSIGSITDKKKELLLILLTWLLASSNRPIRDHVSKTMIVILKERIDLCKALLSEFYCVNDPYIIQRLFGVALGAVLRRSQSSKEEFKDLAEWVYENVFCGEEVYPDILLRDYARLIIERFCYEYPSEAGRFNYEIMRPPYKSQDIPKAEVIDYDNDLYQMPGVRELLFSMKFNLTGIKGIGFYGDFGRYVFQSALEDFSHINIENVYYYSLQFIFKELGYSSELFGEYDSKNSGHYRHSEKKLERIGKKYQWIAMYNILARISDHYSVREWGTDGKTHMLSGAWELYVRDFDPTINQNNYMDITAVPQLQIAKNDTLNFMPVDAEVDDIREWTKDNIDTFTYGKDRLLSIDEEQNEWISLYLFEENKYNPFPNSDHSSGFMKGEQRMWLGIKPVLVETSCNRNELKDILISGLVASEHMDVPGSYTLFCREHAWSPGYHNLFSEELIGQSIEMDNKKIKIKPAVVNINWEGGYDASINDSTSYMVPLGEIINSLQLSEREVDGYFFSGNSLVAFDRGSENDSHSDVVIRKDFLDRFLESNGYQLVWIVRGEKQFFCGNYDQIWQTWDGYYIYSKTEIEEIYVGNREN